MTKNDIIKILEEMQVEYERYLKESKKADEHYYDKGCKKTLDYVLNLLIGLDE